MEKASLTEAVLLLAVLLACIPLTAQEGEAPPIKWHKDLDSALRESYLSGRPVVLHFCPPGRIALNEDMSTFQDNRVKKAALHFVWLRLDPDKSKELLEKYDVVKIPSLVVVDCKERKLNKKNVEEHAFPEDVLCLMREVLSKTKVPSPEEIERIAEDFKKARALVASESFRKAIPLLKKIAKFEPEIGYVKESRKALELMEREALKQIEEAKRLMEKGRKKEADALLRRIEKEKRGLDAAKEARKTRLELYRTRGDMDELRAKDREEQAEKAMRLVELYEANGAYEKAIEKCREIIEKYPDTETAKAAAGKIKELKDEAKKKAKESEEEE